MSLPSRWTVPESGSSKPPAILKMVVFPHPLGPRREKTSPQRTPKFAPFTTRFSPKDFTMFFSSKKSGISL